MPASSSRCLIRASNIRLKHIRWTELFLGLFPPQSIVVECLTLDSVHEGDSGLRWVLILNIPSRFQKIPLLESFNNCTDGILAMNKIRVANGIFSVIADRVIIDEDEYITRPTECLHPYASTIPLIKVSKEARGSV